MLQKWMKVLHGEQYHIESWELPRLVEKDGVRLKSALSPQEVRGCLLSRQ
jgi:hypothetical protein